MTQGTDFPERGILWQGWDEATLAFIAEKGWPVFLFVADHDPTVWPFLRELFAALPKNAKLRNLLHEHFPALLVQADTLPDELSMLGAGTTYHVAVLSPSGLTPMVTIDPVNGDPGKVTDEIVQILERLVDVWS